MLKSIIKLTRNSEFIFVCRKAILHRKLIFFGFSVLIFSTLLLIPYPILMKRLINNLVDKNTMMDLANYIFIFISLLIMKSSLLYLSNYIFEKANKYLVMDIKIGFFSMIQMNYEKFLKWEQGNILSRISRDSESIGKFFFPDMIFFIRNILTFIIALSILIYLNWKLSIVAVTPLILFFLLTEFVNPRIREISRVTLQAHTELMTILTEAIKNMEIFRVYLKEDVNIERFAIVNKNYIYKSLKKLKVIILANLPLEILLGSGSLLSILFGASLVKNNEITIGDLFGFLFLLNFVYEPLPKFLHYNTHIQEINPVLLRIKEIFDKCQCEYENEVLLTEVNSIQINIREFSYDKKNILLKNFQLTLEKGDVVGIKGRSGVGKTTLIRLILGLLIEDGVLINEKIKVNAVNREKWWQFIGYVPQEAFVFSGTIEENLFLQKSSLCLQKIQQEFICDILIHNIIEENGKNLSVGQKQRLNIFRSFCRNYQIIIMDEPIANLDMKNVTILKQLILDANKDKSKIFVIISHQDEILDICNKTILLS